MSLSRAQYAAALVPIAARLVAAVHDEGPDAIRDLVAQACAVPCPPDVDPFTATTVILAAMVDPERSAADLLEWTRDFAHVLIPGRRVPTPAPARRGRAKRSSDPIPAAGAA